MNWFTWSWWKYLLQPKERDVSWITAINCRRRGHPEGVWWHNAGRLEPDMHCKNCGDDLG